MSVAIPDPFEADAWIVSNGAESRYGAQVGPVTITHVHAAHLCEGRACVIHNPSDHHMATWDLNWRDDKGQMERICPCHGVGHPDPDDLAYHKSQGREWMGVHGCPGCCHTDYSVRP